MREVYVEEGQPISLLAGMPEVDCLGDNLVASG